MVSAVGASSVSCSTPRDGQASAPAVRVAQTTRQTTAALTITTADGDTVSFSAAALASATYAKARVQSEEDGQRTAVDATATTRSLIRQTTIAAEGDFDAEELRDIQKLLKGMRKVARQFFRGHVAVAGKKAGRLDPGDSPAGFTLFLRDERTSALALTGTSEAPPSV